MLLLVYSYEIFIIAIVEQLFCAAVFINSFAFATLAFFSVFLVFWTRAKHWLSDSTGIMYTGIPV